MFEPSLGLFATGGIVAAVVAGWNQVRLFVSRLFSLLILTEELHGSYATIIVYKHLNRNYKRIPLNSFSYFVRDYDLDAIGNTTALPVKMNNIERINIWFKGKNFVIARFSGDQAIFFSLKGFSPLTKILVDTFKEEVQRENDDVKVRYSTVYNIVGQEKHSGVRATLTREPEATLDSNKVSNNSLKPFFDYEKDKPLVFAERIVTVATGNNNPFDHLYYDDIVYNVVDNLNKWFDLKSFYVERGIPWNRGILLYGPGGTGKSAFFEALGKMLGIPVYRYFLDTMSSQELIREWENMSCPCLALFEDFDSVFNKRENLTEHKSLSFDTILNLISGAQRKSGIILGVTTNNIDKIDPALGIVEEGNSGISSRPGRIDLVVRVGAINFSNKQKMAKRILKGYEKDIEEILMEAKDLNITPAQFQEMCVQRAYKLINEEIK